MIFNGTEHLFFVMIAILHIRDINVAVGGDDKGAGCNSLYLAVLAICNSVKEVEHSEDNVLIKSLNVKYNCATGNKVVCNCSYLLVRLGTNNLELNAVVTVVNLGGVSLLVVRLRSIYLCSLCLLERLEFHLVSFSLSLSEFFHKLFKHFHLSPFVFFKKFSSDSN